jgi:tRNA(Ile2) C34 agmatinyltransferase TiaS
MENKDMSKIEKAKIEAFFSLVRKPERKERMCLCCGVKFISVSNGNRRCSRCDESIVNFGLMAEGVS